MGKSQRTKGHNWERAVAIDLRHLDPEAKRRLEYQVGGGIDIDTDLPLAIQCKCTPQASVALQGYLEAEAHAGAGQIPVCAWKSDRKGQFALLCWGDFLEMLEVYVRGN